jgi:hypothetical protein
MSVPDFRIVCTNQEHSNAFYPMVKALKLIYLDYSPMSAIINCIYLCCSIVVVRSAYLRNYTLFNFYKRSWSLNFICNQHAII